MLTARGCCTLTWNRESKFRAVGNLSIICAFIVSALVACTGQSVLAEEASSPGLKYKVAVARFSNETRSNTSFFVDESGNKIGKQAADILGARLAQTGKFQMFERQDSDEVSAEKVIAGLSENGVAVDYLIIGSVSEFGRSTESQSGVFQRAKIQKAYSKVNVRLVDVSSGRIVHAAEGTGEAISQSKRTFGVGSSAGFDQSLTDRAISEAISQLVSALVEKITDSPWRSFLVSRQGDNYIMPGGARQGIQPGMSLHVYQKGELVKNPQTGGTIELPGQRIATATVSSVYGDDEFSEISFLKISGSELSSDLTQYYLSDK